MGKSAGFIVVTVSLVGNCVFGQVPLFVGTKAGQVREDNGLKLKLVWCPPGTFTMGSPMDEKGHLPDETQVPVTLTNGFWLGEHEETQAEWKRVMKTGPWSGTNYVKEGDDYPATYLSWDDAMKPVISSPKTRS